MKEGNGLQKFILENFQLCQPLFKDYTVSYLGIFVLTVVDSLTPNRREACALDAWQ